MGKPAEGILPYDPGVLPTLPAPKPGDVIRSEVEGLPPPKTNWSVDPQSKRPMRESFVALRRGATAAMAGRAWVFGPVNMTLFGSRGGERWVRSVKEECLFKVILVGERSLRRALSEYVEH